MWFWVYWSRPASILKIPGVSFHVELLGRSLNSCWWRIRFIICCVLGKSTYVFWGGMKHNMQKPQDCADETKPSSRMPWGSQWHGYRSSCYMTFMCWTSDRQVDDVTDTAWYCLVFLSFNPKICNVARFEFADDLCECCIAGDRWKDSVTSGGCPECFDRCAGSL